MMRHIPLIGVSFTLVNALKAGEVDAINDGYRNFELIELGLDGLRPVAFYPEEHGVPAYDELIYAARAGLRQDNRLPRFLAAIEKATLFLTNHPDEAQTMFFKSHPDIDDPLHPQTFAATLPPF